MTTLTTGQRGQPVLGPHVLLVPCAVERLVAIVVDAAASVVTIGPRLGRRGRRTRSRGSPAGHPLVKGPLERLPPERGNQRPGQLSPALPADVPVDEVGPNPNVVDLDEHLVRWRAGRDAFVPALAAQVVALALPAQHLEVRRAAPGRPRVTSRSCRRCRRRRAPRAPSGRQDSAAGQGRRRAAAPSLAD